MPGLFQMLEIGRRALLSQQFIMQTVGHNIANVDTPGYSRQRVTLASTNPENTPQGQFGSGVTITSVRHARDLFLGVQYREANKTLGQLEFKEKTLSQIESIFSEPQDNSLSNSINEFFNAFSNLSTDPGDGNNRRQVISKANQLINGFRQIGKQLLKIQSNLDNDINNLTSNVNRLSTEIASLNQQIKVQELGNNRANDLRDRRDLLIDHLSNLVDVTTHEQSNGTTTVFMSGMAIVDGSSVIPIDTVSQNGQGTSANRVIYRGTTISLRNRDGQMAGLEASRDEIIPKYLDQLNELARSIMDEVNALHRTGFGDDGSTGLNLFDPSFRDVTTMKLNFDIVQDISKIAASSIQPLVPGEGDNIIALELAALQDKLILGSNTQSAGDFYNGMIGDLGIDSLEVISFRENTELLRQQIDNSRQAVQGVSLDEEMINLIRAQHAFDAAARVITTMDQSLEIVIRGMGIVGR